MKHPTFTTLVVTALLATVCREASAQVFERQSEHRLMAYYAIPLGAPNRAAGESRFGLQLIRERDRADLPGARRHGPPAVDFSVAIRSGAPALRLHGLRAELPPGLVNWNEANDSNDVAETVTALILGGAVLAGVIVYARNAKETVDVLRK